MTIDHLYNDIAKTDFDKDIIKMRSESNDNTYQVIGDKHNTSRETIWNHLKRMGKTYKEEYDFQQKDYEHM
jgi:DNA-binding CsgD family transcriptional regulator